VPPSFTVTGPEVTSVAGAVTGDIATFTPAANLTCSTTYTDTITTRSRIGGVVFLEVWLACPGSPNLVEYPYQKGGKVNSSFCPSRNQVQGRLFDKGNEVAGQNALLLSF
jgi:hypothetical protein